ncbi:putative U2 small nuclear ribonucleoprotein B'' [Blattamonas nauphoetae]|uniref:U2 small nuclear ribonucleoprotein B n=1 Tax=Blattamonas nauphoetae TaxID=2049346 RepID=A0ABQ9XRE1_9EUKA|nr:putative U2 small nuclear ribonucleoprotein B'' [Blattamonas nauphoetae]
MIKEEPTGTELLQTDPASTQSTRQQSSDSDTHTLYVNNLNDKLNKTELKRNLYFLFSQFGHVASIVCMKTPKMRGQAFIIYKERPSALIAMKTLQNKMFFGKEMHIHFSKTKSYLTRREEGDTTVPFS